MLYTHIIGMYGLRGLPTLTCTTQLSVTYVAYASQTNTL